GFERWFAEVYVSRKGGIIRLEGNVHVTVFFLPRFLDGPGDLDRLRRLVCAGDHLEPSSFGAGAGEFVIDVRPELIPERAIVLGRAVRRDAVGQTGNHSGW